MNDSQLLQECERPAFRYPCDLPCQFLLAVETNGDLLVTGSFRYGRHFLNPLERVCSA